MLALCNAMLCMIKCVQLFKVFALYELDCSAEYYVISKQLYTQQSHFIYSSDQCYILQLSNLLSTK